MQKVVVVVVVVVNDGAMAVLVLVLDLVCVAGLVCKSPGGGRTAEDGGRRTETRTG